jgi:hypothetical protein|tara:strand:+ start:14653 stop:15423 length:771 start_codon:yes stop_codon:yes gene_type:complete
MPELTEERIKEIIAERFDEILQPDKGGTGLYSYAKGNIIVGRGVNSLDALTVGSNGQVIIADSTEGLGLKWGALDHGDLDGLGDDDHTQYILVAGTRAFTGEQSMGTNKLTNVVDPTADQDAATKKYVDDNAGGFKTGILTRTNANGTGDQTVAHGLGSVPNGIIIVAFQASSNSTIQSYGSAISTSSESAITMAEQSNGSGNNSELVSDVIVALEHFDSTDYGRATLATLDGTNITINWGTAVNSNTVLVWSVYK